MDKIKSLTVRYQGREVGTLALYKAQLAAFEYSAEWLSNGFAISPFSLPLKKGVFIPKIDPFEGLFGVFSDSLPDGWGRLLLDRLLVKNRIDPRTLSILDRLAIVGNIGMGALTYEPVHRFESPTTSVDLDLIAKECAKVLTTDYDEDLDDLFKLGGSSGGARPKILIRIDEKDWIIKFPSSQDHSTIGAEEYRYSICAKACGIEMTETKLFESKSGPGYFGTVRFDRISGTTENYSRVHMLSASGMLETSHRIPNLDYNILMKLTLELTKDYSEIEKLYRLMCFNVFAHNRDDHSKNFSFLYDTSKEGWRLSPAYDLTYSHSIGGEHATCINGNGIDPGITDLVAVGKTIGMSLSLAKRIASEIEEIVKSYPLY
jgi:serine/threonine-protein kinase HipA